MKPIRITELTQMGTCEKKWWYRYGDPDADDFEGSSPAMTLGTLFHAMWGEWWNVAHYSEMSYDRVLAAIPEDRQEFLTEDIVHHAGWMIGRYDAVYGPTKSEWVMVENEIELKGEIGGLPCEGRADGIVRHIPTDRLFLAECKTMKDWRRLDILTVDPQVTHYWTLARQMGYDIQGVLYDAAKTYRWKRDAHKHPPAESFQRLFIDRTDDQARAAAEEMHAFAGRREDLTPPGLTRIPLRNISAQTCSWCLFRARCWDELAFPETTIELVED